MAITEPCQHGTMSPSWCFYCMHPAVGSAPQTFWPSPPTGWLCPVCRLVHSPSVETCPCRATGRSVTSLSRTDPELRIVPCLDALEGGMCGCDEPRDDEGACLLSECDH